MNGFDKLEEAIDYCLKSRQFSIALLHKEEKAMDMHIHDCYEVYLTLSGGKQFLIGDQLYEVHPNDMFCINPYESHTIMYDENEELERLVVFIHPDYVRMLGSDITPLDACFLSRPEGFSHRRHLSEQEQRLFLFHINQLNSTSGYGSDIMARCRMAEFLLYLNRAMTHSSPTGNYKLETTYAPQVQDALTYINEHITENISLAALAEHLYLSESYLCRIFKASTGTTISKYIVGRRIAIAKTYLSLGYSVAESQARCGFGDYSNFLKAFTRSVGMSPKKYAQLAPRALIASQIPDPPTSGEE